SAVSSLRGYLRREDARLDLVAGLLDDLGKTADAERAYREVIARSKNPSAPLLLAQHPPPPRRGQEALKLCEAAWVSVPAPEVVAAVSLLCVRAGQSSAEQKQRVESWLKAAARKHPRNAALSLFLAESRELAGAHEEAIFLYARVLEQDPRNVI